MKKRMLLSILTIGVVSALVAGAVTAYFTDTEKSGTNMFQAGTIDIDVDGENPWSAAGEFDITDMKPCDVEYIEFTINNVGGNEADVWKHFTVLETRQGVDTEPELEEENGTPKHDIDTVISYDLVVNDEVIIDISEDLKLSAISCYWIYLGKIEPGESMKVVQSYHMQPEVTNWAQGDQMDFEIELFAQQMRGCPPAPGNELAGHEKPADGKYVDIGNPLSELGHLNRDADDWSYVGKSTEDGGTYLKKGAYGGYDGNADFRGLMGPPTGCGAGHEKAKLVFWSCPDDVTTFTLRHLDGSQNDSFDVFVREGGAGSWTKIGHYTDVSGTEIWVTTTFDLPGPMNGKIEIKLVATDPVTSWCEAGWGQVMINWARVD
jgi:predicted ribosomally synthesized peptide with SipW-like signal peptide